MLTTESSVNTGGQETKGPLALLAAIKKLQQENISGVEICKRLGKTSAWLWMHIRLENLHPSLLDQMKHSVPHGKRIGIEVGSKLALVRDHAKQLEIWAVVSQENNLAKRTQKTKKLVRAALAQHPEFGPEIGLTAQKRFNWAMHKIEQALEVFEDLKPRELIGLPKLEDKDGPILVLNQHILRLERIKPKIYQARMELVNKKKAGWRQEQEVKGVEMPATESASVLVGFTPPKT